MPIQSYAIATGWNATPVNIESIVPTGSNVRPVVGGAYYFVRAFPSYSPGQRVTDASGGTFYQGFERVVWLCKVAHPAAVRYMRETYQGQVTVNTTTGEPGVYTEYNALCEVAHPAEIQSRNGMFLDFEIRLLLVSETA